ncbi:ABC-2 type transporter-domain-containing protein [Ilyonectria sp. MPI-CAGE-AT-0026]|nr:ABC-2 type transporter-domain-containing protein [Ilyonectria sp. MPI-CAGE-AT-0026]
MTENMSHHAPNRHRSQTYERAEAMGPDLVQLTQRITANSNIVGGNASALAPLSGSELDPHSPIFDAVAWVKAFMALIQSDPEAPPTRKSGVSFRDLSAFGYSLGSDYQKDVGNVWLSLLSSIRSLIGMNSSRRRIDILRDLEGLVEDGEMCIVLGPPGSGCSTFLRTISGEADGVSISPDSYLNFRGIDTRYMHNWFCRDVLYNAEVDTHLPHLTVGDTLTFAARAAATNYTPRGLSKGEARDMVRDVVMATFGISHTAKTRVGDDYVRGVSGGERKRVSIAEATLTGAKVQCWDNATRGLDSGNAINFCDALRVQADLMDITSIVAMYQAPESAYQLFDKVLVLYEGRQIYFGHTQDARQYFEDLGFECPDKQTTPDFLTSMTSPEERQVKPGFQPLPPRTPDEFAQRWKQSLQRDLLLQELETYEKSHPPVQRLDEFSQSRLGERSKMQRLKSPYSLSYLEQIRIVLWRSVQRLKGDPAFTIAQLLFNLTMALILGSMFYNLKPDTSSFYYRGGLMFFSLLFNAFSSQLEVLTLYAQRPVVEKHKRYALYHQSVEAISSFIIDLPYKTLNMFLFNIIIYFMAGLRKDTGAFFFFCLTTYVITLVMSALYRTLASVTRTSAQAMVPSSLLTMGVMIYTGFTIPTKYMPGWSRWMNYINPLAYAFEALMANEFSGRQFPCAQIVPAGPGYEVLPVDSTICSTVGALPGTTTVDGDRYLALSFEYYNKNKWRDIGILFAYLGFFFIAYIVAAEFAKPPKTQGEVLVFRRGKIPSAVSMGEKQQDPESPPLSRPAGAQKTEANTKPGQDITGEQKPVFHWQNLCYDIKIKGQPRRILDNVDGWVKPGTCTALMGASGAGKTTLLDTLATRVTMGVISGDTMIDGKPTDASFQHRVGYVQQQDIHLDTMTVREALVFSAILRQSAEISKQDKLAYVDHVIEMLSMQEFADAIIGTPGSGLNVEQRKRLTIGVELAARPQLLVFLDEPTSGLDSQTSWAICDLIQTLVNSGQAVLCTIHQPSAMLFQRFDRLLLLQPGGKTLYFGELGPNSSTLISYLERNGAPKCPANANPAEWMLESTSPGEGALEWFDIWRSSPEYKEVQAELQRLRDRSNSTQPGTSDQVDASQHQEFVAPITVQSWEVLKRTAAHYWRSPTYIYSKASLAIFSSLYIGFSFSAKNSLQGLQNQLYAFFMFLVLFGNLNEQIMPFFIPQRAIYEVRERTSKIYRWQTYLLANVVVEIAWNTVLAAVVFFCWYYPVGFQANTTSDDAASRGLLGFLFLWQFFLFTSTFSHLVIIIFDTPDLAGTLASLMWMLCISFCGVGVKRVDLPAIWRDFMYHVSPATYLVSGVMSTCIHGSKVVCSSNEELQVAPPTNMSCLEFLGPYASTAGGHLLNPAAVDTCRYCPMSNTDQFLATFNIDYADRWRNFGLLWVYIGFNVAATVAIYWLFRVPKSAGMKQVSAKSG